MKKLHGYYHQMYIITSCIHYQNDAFYQNIINNKMKNNCDEIFLFTVSPQVEVVCAQSDLLSIQLGD